MYQASVQFRNTVAPAPFHIVGSTSQAPPSLAMSIHSPCLEKYPSQRTSPIQAPSLRVAPRVNPANVAYPRVNPTLPHHSVITLTRHPSTSNAPYVHQGMAGMNLFDTFEGGHTETPSLPSYNTKSRARQHSDNNDRHHAPRVFLPITFTNTQVFHTAPKQAIN
jgi:hypothetical protein